MDINYQWKEDEIFHLTGREFELLLNSTRLKLNSKEAQEILLAVEMNKVLEKVFKEGIASGKVYPAPQTEDIPHEEVKEKAPN